MSEEVNKGGRPSHEPSEQTRRMVESMSGYGVPQDEIASVVGVDPKTLRKHYEREIAAGAVKANVKVAETLFKKATSAELTGASVTAAIFWLKARAGWRDRDPTPVETDIAHENPEKLGKKERALLEASAAAENDPEFGDLLRPRGLPN